MHPTLNKAATAGKAAAAEVEQVTNYLAELMAEIHGGAWHIMIDHEVQLIAISRNFPSSHGEGV